MIGNRQLSFRQVCDLGDRLIVIDELGEGIFQINKEDMSTKLLAAVKETNNPRNLYQAVEYCQDEIFFFPVFMDAGVDIVVYHTENQYIEYLDLGELDHAVSGDYRPVKRIADSVLLFPTDLTRDLIRFRLDIQEIEIIESWKNVMKKITLDYTDPYAKLWDVKEIQGKLYHTIRGTNYIVEIDKKDFQVKCHTISADVKLYTKMDYDGEKLWIAAYENRGVVSWNPDTQKTEHYPVALPEENLSKNDNWIDHILCGKSFLWLIPRRDNKMIRMNYASGTCEYVDIFPDKFCLRKGNSEAFHMIRKDGNIADLYPYFSNIVIHLDLKNDELLERYEQILFPREWTEEDIIHYQQSHRYETDRLSAGVFLDSFLKNIDKDTGKEIKSNNGDKIWGHIKLL